MMTTEPLQIRVHVSPLVCGYPEVGLVLGHRVLVMAHRDDPRCTVLDVVLQRREAREQLTWQTSVWSSHFWKALDHVTPSPEERDHDAGGPHATRARLARGGLPGDARSDAEGARAFRPPPLFSVF